jgi:dCMP deaminase
MKKIIVAYVPVIQRGIINLIEAHKDAEVFYVFGEDILADFDYLRKEIRALNPHEALRALTGLQLLPKIEILDRLEAKRLGSVLDSTTTIVMPEDDLSPTVAENYFGLTDVIFAPVFLRWNRDNAHETRVVAADRTISREKFDREMMQRAFLAAGRSSDWWRQVGGILVQKETPTLFAWNRHVPSEYSPYIDGDPRNCFKKGVHIELSTALHAEAGIIAEAARKGFALAGGSLYVSTFPCPPCAKLIAYSGIARCYFGSGYAMLDGESILREKNVELIFVETEEASP